MNETHYFDYAPQEKLCILYTFKCTAACGHCITKSNMERHEKLDILKAKEIMDTALEFNKKVVILSGGEVFLYYEELLELTRYAANAGLDVLIETNGFWASDTDETLKKLAALKENGLVVLFVSYDAFHSPYIPFSNINRIMDAAESIGLKHEIMFTRSDSPGEDAIILEKLTKASYEMFEDELLPFGRAGKFFNASAKKEYDDLGCCESITTTFLPNGDVFSCCNISDENWMLKKTPMYLGNIFNGPIRDMFQMEKTNCFLKIITSETRIKEFVEFLKDQGYHQELEKQYFTICDLCMELAANQCFTKLAEKFKCEKDDTYGI
ncbi:MAG: radical SAM protein [Clostridia bacterium]|nr:radical SAM protein [Clostridia bacterium]